MSLMEHDEGIDVVVLENVFVYENLLGGLQATNRCKTGSSCLCFPEVEVQGSVQRAKPLLCL